VHIATATANEAERGSVRPFEAEDLSCCCVQLDRAIPELAIATDEAAEGCGANGDEGTCAGHGPIIAWAPRRNGTRSPSGTEHAFVQSGQSFAESHTSSVRQGARNLCSRSGQPVSQSWAGPAYENGGSSMNVSVDLLPPFVGPDETGASDPVPGHAVGAVLANRRFIDGNAMT
jgi:hypothetical protein